MCITRYTVFFPIITFSPIFDRDKSSRLSGRGTMAIERFEIEISVGRFSRIRSGNKFGFEIVYKATRLTEKYSTRI